MSTTTKKEQLLQEAKDRYKKAHAQVMAFLTEERDEDADDEEQITIWDLRDAEAKAGERYQSYKRIQDWLKEDGTLVFCDLSGNPIAYLDKDNSVLCSDCAEEALHDESEIPAFRPIVGFVCEEGYMSCDTCSKVIFDEDDEGEEG